MSAAHEHRLQLAETDYEAAGRLADEAMLRRETAMQVLASHRWSGTQPSLAEYVAWSEAHVEYGELNAIYLQQGASMGTGQRVEDTGHKLLYAL